MLYIKMKLNGTCDDQKYQIIWFIIYVIVIFFFIVPAVLATIIIFSVGFGSRFDTSTIKKRQNYLSPHFITGSEIM